MASLSQSHKQQSCADFPGVWGGGKCTLLLLLLSPFWPPIQMSCVGAPRAVWGQVYIRVGKERARKSLGYEDHRVLTTPEQSTSRLHQEGGNHPSWLSHQQRMLGSQP